MFMYNKYLNLLTFIMLSDMALARWLVQNVQSGSEDTDKDSSSIPDNEQMQLLLMEGENYKEIQ